jgi:tRNA A-37 threonylcarbamoyl transferase component Bud32
LAAIEAGKCFGTCAPSRSGAFCPVRMLEVKDTLRATVRLSYDGRVYKTFHGPDAQQRFDNEVRVLRHLEKAKCNFVPRLLDVNPELLRIVTTNCGARVEHLDEQRAGEIFAELEPYGVRHEDAEVRNITYRQTDGRFCVIDFEFATILPGLEEVANGSAK